MTMAAKIELTSLNALYDLCGEFDCTERELVMACFMAKQALLEDRRDVIKAYIDATDEVLADWRKRMLRKVRPKQCKPTRRRTRSRK